jgi:hypothetical protein
MVNILIQKARNWGKGVIGPKQDHNLAEQPVYTKALYPAPSSHFGMLWAPKGYGRLPPLTLPIAGQMLTLWLVLFAEDDPHLVSPTFSGLQCIISFILTASHITFWVAVCRDSNTFIHLVGSQTFLVNLNASLHDPVTHAFCVSTKKVSYEWCKEYSTIWGSIWASQYSAISWVPSLQYMSWLGGHFMFKP